MKNIAILGSTGSIGCNTLEVIEASQGRLKAMGLTAHRNLRQLGEQAAATRPRWIAASDPERAARFDWSGLPAETELLIGVDGLEKIAAHGDVDQALHIGPDGLGLGAALAR